MKKLMMVSRLSDPEQLLKMMAKIMFGKIAVVGAIFLFVLIGTVAVFEEGSATDLPTLGGVNLPSEVLVWESEMREWVLYYELDERWVWILLVMMYVESRGLMSDLMQSSESAGLPPNTLQYEESIAQAVRYLKRIIERAESLDLGDDQKAIIQSYNFGIAYLNWLSINGFNHNVDVAALYSRTVVAPSLGNHDGVTYPYENEVSLANGRPYLFLNGGNFHYAYLVIHILNRSAVGGVEIREGVVLPLDPPFVITSVYGMRWGRMHEGIDLTGGFGVPVRSVMDGTVIYVVNRFGSNDGFLGHPSPFGNVVFVEHEDNVMTIYAHLHQDVRVRVGDVVMAGQIIGFEGNSGHSTGSHLHFEWHESGHPVNPELRIDFRGSQGVE